MAKCIKWNSAGRCVLREGEEGTEKEESLASSAMTIDAEGNKNSKLAESMKSDTSFLNPGEDEQALLDLIGEEGLNQLQQLFTEGFQLDDSTRSQLDALRETRMSRASDNLDYALDQATGRATAGAAGRGLSQGSLRAELQTRLSNPAIQRFQNQTFAIDEQDSMQRLALPRQDFQLRQQALNSPALTALQRNRLGNAELRLRLASLNEQKNARKSNEGGILGGGLGRLAGAAAGSFLGPLGTAAGAAIGDNLFGGGGGGGGTGVDAIVGGESTDFGEWYRG